VLGWSLCPLLGLFCYTPGLLARFRAVRLTSMQQGCGRICAPSRCEAMTPDPGRSCFRLPNMGPPSID
jgi:hypothetical protein